MENEGEAQNNETNKKSSVVIRIPSYQEVVESSQSRSTPPSLFVPSQTFSQAFAFVKSSEFYSPPPSLPKETVQSNASSSTPPPSSATTTAPVASSKIPNSQPTQNRNAILVSNRQKGNPLLKYIRNVRWTFADVVCDFLLSQTSCALYLSLRYHLLHPDYLYYRIRELQKNFKLRVVLCHVDVPRGMWPLLRDHKSLRKQTCRYYSRPIGFRLSITVRHVNKTDVVTLGTNFGSLSNIMGASMEDLARCPGIGERKVKRLFDTFHEPFKRVESSRQAIPETSVLNKPASPDASFRNNAEASSSIEDKQKDVDNASKRSKKEPGLTVKSALSEAFAKLSERAGKRNITSKSKEKEDPIAVRESDAET
ncbi:DNA excision repair protein ERCC-1 isoform X3 [Lathyrus oleraceus]|uniref:DNA excision repair protein ERCC-1 isoform X3 n=1 Tax=Pisum sativum TaxID=3888 RepID=UPI0021D2F782|nr:DNA excision repair protein ERCC-1 isoform X3 [Pisum sativum]